MRRPIRLVGLICLLVSAGLAAQESAPTDPQEGAAGLVTVNGQVLTRELYAAFLREQLKQNPLLAENRQQQMALLNRLVNFALMAQDAVDSGLDRRPTTAAQLELARSRILTNAAIQDYLGRHPVPEERLRQLYQERYQQQPRVEFRVEHILLDTEAGAIAVLEALEKGESFAALAAERSRDSTAGDGGDLGWMSPAQMDPALRAAVEQLKDGDYARLPVRSGFGWHVVRRTRSREIPQESYGEVRDSLLREQQRVLLQEYIAELRRQAEVQVNAR